MFDFLSKSLLWTEFSRFSEDFRCSSRDFEGNYLGENPLTEVSSEHLNAIESFLFLEVSRAFFYPTYKVIWYETFKTQDYFVRIISTVRNEKYYIFVRVILNNDSKVEESLTSFELGSFDDLKTAGRTYIENYYKITEAHRAYKENKK